MKNFCFTIDDNIRFLQEINENKPESLFLHPYLSLLKDLHEEYDVKIQLNLFYENTSFSLANMTTRYKKEWKSCAEWLKLSFHSAKETVRPYENAGYDRVFADCNTVKKQIIRFAGEESLGKTSTIHYCAVTESGLSALKACGIMGLLGLYGTKEFPKTSYSCSDEYGDKARSGEIIGYGGLFFSGIDIILNNFSPEEIRNYLSKIINRTFIKIMIHEQYFYSDWHHFEADYKERIVSAIKLLRDKGFNSVFFEEML